jgi:hypothetical protein
MWALHPSTVREEIFGGFTANPRDLGALFRESARPAWRTMPAM